jgi:hypothetical protein
MKSRRKTILIDPRFQLKFIYFNCLVALAVGLSIYAANFFFIYRMKKIGEQSGLAADSVFYKLIDQQGDFLRTALMISLIVALTIIAVFGLSMSHKIAGPIHNLKKNLRDRIEQGKYRPFQVRKNDFFQDLAELMEQYDKKVNPRQEKSKDQ